MSDFLEAHVAIRLSHGVLMLSTSTIYNAFAHFFLILKAIHIHYRKFGGHKKENFKSYLVKCHNSEITTVNIRMFPLGYVCIYVYMCMYV